MSRNKYIAIAVLLCMCSALPAKPKAKAEPQLTQEEQMRSDYYLYAALDAMDRKSHAEAYFLLELCYTVNPTDPTVCSLRGSYVQNLYGKEAALPLFRTAYEGSPQDYWYRYTIAAYEAGQRNTAMNVLKEMEKRDPKNIDILELHEHILLHENKHKQALAIRDKVDKLTGEPTIQSVLARYETYRDMGDEKKGLEVLDAYLARNPNDGRMRAMRTDIYLKDARHAGNTAEGQRLLELQLHSADVTLHNKIKLLQMHSDWLGYDAATQKEWLLDLREQYPYEQDVYQALLDHEESQGHISAALEISRTMLTMNPSDAQLREKIADLMRDDDNVTPEEVGRFVEESYTMLPDDPKWGYFKALRCLQRNDYDSALIVMENAVAHAEEPMVRLQLLATYGDLLGHAGQYEKAYATYDEVLKLAPDHLSVLNNYAWTLAINGGDLKKAEKMSQRTIQKESNNATYLDTYAWILHLQGQDTLALFYIKKAMEYAQTDSDGTIAQHMETIQQSLQQQSEQ